MPVFASAACDIEIAAPIDWLIAATSACTSAGWPVPQRTRPVPFAALRSFTSCSNTSFAWSSSRHLEAGAPASRSIAALSDASPPTPSAFASIATSTGMSPRRTATRLSAAMPVTVTCGSNA